MNKRFFKVGSFNLLNLQLPGEKYYNRYYRHDEFEKKVAWQSNQLSRMNADIIGFQELFSLPALQQVLDASGRYQGAGIEIGQKNADGPAVALVSRFPILETMSITDFPKEAILEVDGIEIPLYRFSRPVLRAKIKIHGELEAVVFVVHLKSKRPKIKEDANPHDPRERAMGNARSLMIRAAESTALRHLLLDAMEGTRLPVMVIGDFNDDGGAVTSDILVGAQPWRNLPNQEKQRLWDVYMYNVKDIQSRQSYRDVYYTHIHNGHYDSLDHILVSEEFVRQNPNRLGYVEYVKVYNDHLIDETLSYDRIPLWESDHGQVTVTIQLEKGVAGTW